MKHSGLIEIVKLKLSLLNIVRFLPLNMLHLDLLLPDQDLNLKPPHDTFTSGLGCSIQLSYLANTVNIYYYVIIRFIISIFKENSFVLKRKKKIIYMYFICT